jgi:hypothetical protein
MYIHRCIADLVSIALAGATPCVMHMTMEFRRWRVARGTDRGGFRRSGCVKRLPGRGGVLGVRSRSDLLSVRGEDNIGPTGRQKRVQKCTNPCAAHVVCSLRCCGLTHAVPRTML